MQNPRFLDVKNPAGADNRFFTDDDGFQLMVLCSPALNIGNNAIVASINTDIRGLPRIYNGGTVDLGAYETQMLPGNHLKTVYVKNTDNSGTQDGSTWQNAFRTLQDALLYCADTIKMNGREYIQRSIRIRTVFSI